MATAVAAIVWAAAAPSSEQPVRPDVLFPSYQPTGSFPLLSTGRQRLFVMLIGAGAIVSIVVALAMFRLLRNLSGQTVRNIGFIAQVPLAVIALRAMYLNPRLWTIKVLTWDRTTLVVSTIAACALTLVVVSNRFSIASLPMKARRIGEWAILAAATIVAARFAISIFETPNSLKDPGNTSYLTNELLAPSVGSHPLLGYKATYSNLLGYVAWPFVRAGLNGPSVITWLLTVCTVLTLFGTYTLLRMIVRGRWAFVGTALVVGTTAAGRIPAGMPTRNGDLRVVNDAFSYHQIMPLRFLGVVLMANLAVIGLRHPTRRVAALTGFVGALVALNNPDFGTLALIGAAVAMASWQGAASALRPWLWDWWQFLRSALLGMLGAIVAVTLVCLVLARRVPDLWGLTAGTRSYAGGIIALPLGDVFDFHIVIIGTYLVSFLVGSASLVYGVRSSRRAVDVALQFVGVVGIGSMAYYANRPVISTLAGAQFFTWGICLVLLCIKAGRSDLRQRREAALSLVVLSTMSLTAFTQVMSPPATGAEWRRLRDGRTDTEAIMLSGVDLVAVVRAHSPRGSAVAIVSPWPKTIANAAGVRDVIPISTLPFATYPELDEVMDSLDDNPTAIVYIAEPYGYPEVRQRLDEAGYEPIASDRGFAVMARGG